MVKELIWLNELLHNRKRDIYPDGMDLGNHLKQKERVVSA